MKFIIAIKHFKIYEFLKLKYSRIKTCEFQKQQYFMIFYTDFKVYLLYIYIFLNYLLNIIIYLAIYVNIEDISYKFSLFK